MANWNNAKVFVSGGAGVIGSALVAKLLEQKAIVFVGDLKPFPEAWKDKVLYRPGDLNLMEQQEILDFQPEYFFHLAATFERSIENYEFWDENYHHNIRLSHHLISCLKECLSLKKVIFASSYLIYDPKLYLFSQPQTKVKSLKENSAIYPRNLCGMAKLLHEEELNFIKSFKKDSFEYVSARIFRSYGKNSRDIVSRWVRALLNNEPITIYCPEGKFDFIYAGDVAEGLLRLAESEIQGVVNLGNGHARSILEVIEILREHFPQMKSTLEKSAIPFEASEADMSDFEKLTNWRPQHKLEDAIPKIISFEKKRT